MDEQKTSIQLKRIKQSIYPVKQNEKHLAARYNNTNMHDNIELEIQGFSQRLAKLRLARNVSAREMSLSIGQGAGYINNIESGKNLPSMAMFFEICEYLKISPAEFFDYEDCKGLEIDINNQTLEGLSKDDQKLIKWLIARLTK